MLDNKFAKVIAAILIGTAGGYIVASPQPIVDLLVAILPLIVLLGYIAVLLLLLRGLQWRELIIIITLIAGGAGYLIAKHHFAQSLRFVLLSSLPFLLSNFIHALLRKYHDTPILKSLRKTRLVQFLQAEIKL